MSNTNHRSRFGEQLRQQLERHPSIKSVRRLSREVAPHRPENMRRQLHWWIKGAAKPTKESRRAVAVALGVDPSVFADPDDEEDLLPRALLLKIAARMGPPEIPARGLYETVDETLARHFRRSAMSSLARVVEIEKELA